MVVHILPKFVVQATPTKELEVFWELYLMVVECILSLESQLI